MENNTEISLYDRFKDLNQKEINDEFIFASFQYKTGFEKVIYLLTSPELKLNADIHHCNDYALVWACTNGDFKLVEFLLTSPFLKDHISPNARDGYAFRWACENEHMDIVKYLLSSPNLKEHADIHSQDDEVFKICCKRGYLDMIKYFIFELNMQKTSEIEKYLQEYHLDFSVEEINNWFENKKIQNELEKELKHNPTKINNKIKL
jgi:ankyrin repeat protein